MKRALFIVLAACGGLDNRPLHTGSVTGTVTHCDPTQAVAGIVDGASVSVDGDCAFRLDGVPEGPAKLFVVRNPSFSAALDIDVPAASVVALGDVETAHGASLHLKAHAPGKQKVSGQLHTPGIPLMPQSLDTNGSGKVGPFPGGCWVVAISVAGLGELSQTPCFTNDQDMDVDVTMPMPDGSKGREGCSVSGCEDQTTCSGNGNCN